MLFRSRKLPQKADVLPGSHGMHFFRPTLSEYDPGAHSVHGTFPDAENLPFGHFIGFGRSSIGDEVGPAVGSLVG